MFATPILTLVSVRRSERLDALLSTTHGTPTERGVGGCQYYKHGTPTERGVGGCQYYKHGTPTERGVGGCQYYKHGTPTERGGWL